MPFSLEWLAEPSHSDESAIMIASGSAPGFGHSDDPPDFDYLTWSGERRPLLGIRYDDSKGSDFNRPPWLLLIPSAETHYFAFAPSEEIEVHDIYWVDILKKELFGYQTVCELMTTHGEDAIAIGSKWLTYVCDEDQTTWHAFSLEDPSITNSFQLPFDEEFSKSFEPFWLDADTLILDRGGKSETRCIVDLSDSSAPVVSCQEFDLYITLGRFSPDGDLMEVRVSIDTTYLNPQEIGVLNTACFSSSIGCFPNLFPSPFGSEAAGVFLEDSAWLPDSSGILYIQLQSIISAWADNTYLWLFDIHQRKFTQIAYIDEPLEINPYFNHLSAFWSPDGARVLLQNINNIYAFDLNDGTLQLLSDEGGVAIGTIVLP
ncbi:MAG: hypothetical protein KAR65_08515 [Anaerolineales bacterium]|nr:hypothetical protein [Anaerolineales bacterium]MCK5635481.1 hypothetical protein [Anaerolineales bacterium]